MQNNALISEPLDTSVDKHINAQSDESPDEPLVSVIITCYNHEKYIEQCIRSIYSQTHKNIELIVIDDGSKDSSGAIIKALLPESPFKNTKYINQENQGACIARNKGLDLAKGEYILIVDSDNYLDNNHIETLLKTSEDLDIDIVYTSLKNGNTGEILFNAPEFNLERLFEGNFIDTCSLFRKSCLKTHRFDVELNRKFNQDYDFFLSLIMDGASAVKCNETSLNYRILEGSIGIGNFAGDTLKTLRYLEVYKYITSKYPEAYPAYASGLENMLIGIANSEIKYHEKADKYERMFNDLANSVSYKLGAIVAKPLYSLKKLLR